MGAANKNKRRLARLLPYVFASVSDVAQIAGKLEALQLMYEAFNAGPEHSCDGHVQEQVEAYRALPEWSYVLGNIPDCGFQERIRVEEFEVPREIITTVSHGNSVTRACSLPDRLFGSRTRFLYQWTSSNGWEIVIHAGVQFDWDRLYEINVPGRGLFGRIKRRFSKGYVDNYGL